MGNVLEKINRREARVGVVGLGYVGLPLGMAFAEAGFKVLGFEVDARKVEKVRRGESYIKHIGSEPLRALVQAGKLEATADFARSGEADCIVICVPTPLTQAREPDMSHIRQTAEALAPNVRRGQLYVLESTTYPGTTEEVLRPVDVDRKAKKVRHGESYLTYIGSEPIRALGQAGKLKTAADFSMSRCIGLVAEERAEAIGSGIRTRGTARPKAVNSGCLAAAVASTAQQTQ